jgi:outer membrane protein
MKHIKFICLLLLAPYAWQAAAQKSANIGYIDTDYILGQLPEYRSAQKELDDLSIKWQKELEEKAAELDKVYRDYQDEKILLTDELKRKREQQIADKEKAMREFQKQKFGPDGELFKKRQDLVKPLQDKVFDAVQKVAKKSGLDFIFDKGGDMVMMYANAKFDKSDEVLEELGVVPAKGEKEAPTIDKGGAKPPIKEPIKKTK